MNKDFKVSVIIPVYNAEKFLENAVESAVNIPEVGEVILVEDNSPDNSLELCKILNKRHRKIKFYQHENCENKGAGASRNLGIQKASFEYVAFLDADDWFLPTRFEVDKKIFKEESIDGVYSAVGYFIQNKGIVEGKLTTIRKSLDPNDLLYYLLIGHYGHFCTDGITLRKRILSKTGGFNDLKLHQDSHLWYRLAYFGNLVAGCITEPVAMRRVHEENRIKARNKYSRFLLMKSVYKQFRNYDNVDKRAMRLIIKKYIDSKSINRIHKFYNYLIWIIKDPLVLKKI